MNQENLLQLASTQALAYAEWFRQDDPDSAGDTFRFETFARPSGVIDLFVIGDGGGFTSDLLFHVGYFTLRGAWVETFGGADEIPYGYFSGPADSVGSEIVVPAVA